MRIMGCKCISIDKVKVEGRGGMGGLGEGQLDVSCQRMDEKG